MGPTLRETCQGDDDRIGRRHPDSSVRRPGLPCRHGRLRLLRAAPARSRQHAVPADHHRRGAHGRGRRPPVPAGRAGRADPAHLRGHARHRALPAPGPPGASCGPSWTTPRPPPTTGSSPCDLLKNANIAAGGVLPMCQDTGTAIVMGKKAERVLTGGGDEEAIARGVYDAYTHAEPALLPAGPADHVGRAQHRLQPAGPDRAVRRRAHGEPRTSSCSWPRAAARRTSRSCSRRPRPCSTRSRMTRFLDEKLRSLGTAACPPYHLAIVIGGTSAEYALKTAKYASAQVPRHAADLRLRRRSRLPRPRARGAGARADPGLRHRRAVRRQVLLPRRARGPAAAPRRLLPGRDRRLVLGRPPGPAARSPPTASSWSSWRPTRRTTCRRPPTTRCRRRRRARST